MTEKQKKALLKAEGWKQHQIDTAFWWDPKSTPNPKEFGYEVLPDAYRIASRRKRQREAARLRRAGWSFDRVNEAWDCGECVLFTREAALQTLEAQP